MQENTLERLLRRAGGEHRYQYALFWYFAAKWVIAAMLLFSLNFFYIVPDFVCTQQEMIGYESCEDYVCSHADEQFWVSHLAPPLPASIALDFGVAMVCSNAWILSLLQAMSYFGALVGYIVMAHLADNHSRKKAELAAWIVSIAGQTILLLSLDLFMVAFGTFLIGFGVNASLTLHYSFLKELVLGQIRQRMIIALQITFSVGIAFVSLLSLVISGWKMTLGLCMLLPSLLVLAFQQLLEDTLGSTLAINYGQLLSSLNRIARFNGQCAIEQDEMITILSSGAKIQSSQVSLLDLFRYTSLRRLTLVCGAINMVIEFIYDGSILTLDKIGINVYFNQIFVGVVEVSAALFGSWIVPKVFRKQYICISFALLAVLSLAAGLSAISYSHRDHSVDIYSIMEVVLLSLSRFLINSVWGVFFVFVAELFPTEISSLSFAWVSTVGTIGAMISPFIRLVTAKTTMFLICLLSLTAALLVRLLKETKGQTISNRILEKEDNTACLQTLLKAEDDAPWNPQVQD